MRARVYQASSGILAVLFLGAAPFPGSVVEPGTRYVLQDEDRFSRTLKVGPSAALDLSNVSGDIVIRGDAGDEIVIEAETNGDPSRVRIDVSQTGDRVHVQTRYTRGRNGPSVDFTVSVPPGTAVTVASVSGDVRVEDVDGAARAESVSGDVEVTNLGNLVLAKSVSGDVSVESASSQQELELNSVSGDVVVSSLSARETVASTVSGEVSLTDVTCERASVESVSGGIRYHGSLSPGGRYEFESHSGDIRLEITNEIGFELAAQTFSGSIETDLPLTLSSGRVSEGEVRGVYGDGSALIEASSFSGNVSVESN